MTNSVADKQWSMKLTDIPLGSWDHHGNWFPDLRLKMSLEDQWQHNMRGGHFENQYKPADCRLTLVRDDPTIWDRLLKWFK